jgi:hypothetical protein
MYEQGPPAVLRYVRAAAIGTAGSANEWQPVRRDGVPDDPGAVDPHRPFMDYAEAAHRGRVADWVHDAAGSWNYVFGGQANVVELYISHLRKKIGAGRKPMIHTMRSAGYVLRPAD